MYRSGLNNAGEEVEKLVERISYINRGKLKYSDFIMATFDKSRLLKDDLIMDAFKQFNKGDDGVLSREDIMAAIDAGGGTPLPQQELEQLLADFESIDFNQFKDLLKGCTESLSPFKLPDAQVENRWDYNIRVEEN